MTQHIVVDNKSFLQACFGEDWLWSHVTDFMYDPAGIPDGRQRYAWAGDYANNYQFAPESNQYFTISLFYCDDQSRARRLSRLYRKTCVIMLDDVHEKLDVNQVKRLPEPSWVLETSKGSEQWGYILEQPCEEMHRAQNLLDGLVEKGLAPNGKDPGMKGVTRYGRLPEGYNRKVSKYYEGRPFKCQMLVWEPERKTTLEALAAPFDIDLDTSRRESRTDGAANIPDHPLLNTDALSVKEVLSDGRFDVTCPWVDEHTGASDSGTAVFTNDDGSIGFKCHHGHCEGKTGRDLMRHMDSIEPGFTNKFSNWLALRSFSQINSLSSPAPVAAPAAEEPLMNFLEPPEVDGVELMMVELSKMPFTSPEATDLASKILIAMECLPQIDKINKHNALRDTMRWTKTELTEVLRDLRGRWKRGEPVSQDFHRTVFFVRSENKFYDWKKDYWLTAEGFQNSFADMDDEARKTALVDGFVDKVDKLNYQPGGPRTWEEDGVVYGNTYYGDVGLQGRPGDASPWLNHFDTIGWSDNQAHLLDWMAYTIQHPEKKINHMLILGGTEGTGKDYLLYPLIKALGRNSKTVPGSRLKGDFNEFLSDTKHLYISELEVDPRESSNMNNILKPLACAPPEQIYVNGKGKTGVWINNLINGCISTNSHLPFTTEEGVSRRYYAVWGEVDMRDARNEMLPEWTSYWAQCWQWMQDGGVEMCINYLKHRDVSKFNPGAPPPMTDFMRSITEQSQSPVEQTVAAFLDARVGAFGYDLATAADLTATLRMGDTFSPGLLYARADKFTPNVVAEAMRRLKYKKLEARRGNSKRSVWVLTGHEKYAHKSRVDLMAAYEEKRSCKLKVVG